MSSEQQTDASTPMPSSQSAGPPHDRRFKVVKCPSVPLALTNRLTVHQDDWPPSDCLTHVWLDNLFPLTIVRDDTGELQQGQVGLSTRQQRWMRPDGPDLDMITVQPLNLRPGEMILQSLTLKNVDTLRQNLDSHENNFANEMMTFSLKSLTGQIFQVGQQLVYKSFQEGRNELTAVVESLVSVDASGNIREDMGALDPETNITFSEAIDGRIKIKQPAKTTSKPILGAPSKATFPPGSKYENKEVGGLDSQFATIVRRVFISRHLSSTRIEQLGLRHVKGILLFGPPGTGKTLMARRIGKMLRASETTIVSGPQILNKYLGESEKNIRNLFEKAKEAYKTNSEDSGLYVIIFDELDAICKQRGSGGDVTSGVGDSIVNQLLSMMDGVKQLNNVLIIGTTNRIDMIDQALLRPGRFEVHIEVSLPDETGRLQILEIHTAKMKANNVMDPEVNMEKLAKLTENFSGAEISGLVRNATSFALDERVELVGLSGKIDDFMVQPSHFEKALKEIQPAFGTSEAELQSITKNDMYHFAGNTQSILNKGARFAKQVRASTQTQRVTVLLHGPPGSGKTALAAKIATADDPDSKSKFPFIKFISPDNMVGFSEFQKVATINKVFADSYKSPLSVIILDDIERLLGWVPVGPHFSNAVLQALLVLLKRAPPEDRRLLIIATTSDQDMLTKLQLSKVIDAELYVPPIMSLSEVESVLKDVNLFTDDRKLQQTIDLLERTGFGDVGGVLAKWQIGIKRLLNLIAMVRQAPYHDQVDELVQSLKAEFE